jgi:hypothetical protein
MKIGLPKGMRQPTFKHSVGISIVVPEAHAFVATPTMSPGEIAYNRGRDIARRGRKADENPYGDEQETLSAEWLRGFEDERR